MLKDGAAEVHKINGAENPADLFIKHLARELIVKNMSRLGFRFIDPDDHEIGCKDIKQEIIEEDEEESDEYHDEIDCLIKHVNQIYYVLFCPFVVYKKNKTGKTSVPVRLIRRSR